MVTLPKVSIGIITYNHEHFLAECLDSVLAQTYPNFEITIADDCSKDRTHDIALEYARKHPDRIKRVIRSEKNLGMAGKPRPPQACNQPPGSFLHRLIWAFVSSRCWHHTGLEAAD